MAALAVLACHGGASKNAGWDRVDTRCDIAVAARVPDFSSRPSLLRTNRILKTSEPSRIIRGFSCGDCCRFRGSHWNKERKPHFWLLMRRHVCWETM